ncbi:MAG: S41 family peptidase [Verrucomicrobiota bacterium]
MLRLVRLITCCAVATLGSLVWADETPVPPPIPGKAAPRAFADQVNDLDQGQLQEAFRLLTRDYIDRDRLDPLEINRAALQGLLTRLEFGAMLLNEEERAARNSPFKFFSEAVNETTGYVRFGRFNENGVNRLDQAISDFGQDENVETLIIDLRSPQSQAAFSIAAQILSRFRPPNELLFKIRRPDQEQPTLFLSQPTDSSWFGNLILLVDDETGNVGEIIAAVLKRENRCLIIGTKTPGLTVEYRDVPIGESQVLRYAVAEVVLEDDSSLFQVGIEPDILTPVPRVTKRALFRRTDGGETLASHLYLRERPRRNEAALVAGTDPELDYYILRSADKPTPWDSPPPQDRALLQAVDLLNATEFLDGEPAEARTAGGTPGR